MKIHHVLSFNCLKGNDHSDCQLPLNIHSSYNADLEAFNTHQGTSFELNKCTFMGCFYRFRLKCNAI